MTRQLLWIVMRLERGAVSRVSGVERCAKGGVPGDDEAEGHADGKKCDVEGHDGTSLVEEEDVGDCYGCWRRVG